LWSGWYDWLVEKIVSSFYRWVALVQILVVVIDEVFVLLEVVLLSF
jgi:hypothetical protein